MTNVADIVLEGKPMSHEGRDLRTSDVLLCAHELEKLAVTSFMARTRLTEQAIREWLINNRPGAATPRQEFDEAVRRYLNSRWGIS